MKIALIGGHGKVALLAASLLVEAGHSVTSIIRNPEHSAEVEATGATALVVDIEQLDQAGWNELLAAGFDAVIWSAGAGGGNPSRTWAVDFTAAKRSVVGAVRAGIKRYVMVSYVGSSLRHSIPESSPFWHYAQAKAEADTFLRGSGIDYVILGPSTLTLDSPTGMIHEIEHDRDTTAKTSRANVARMVAAAIEAPADHVNRTVRFTDGDTPVAAVFN